MRKRKSDNLTANGFERFTRRSISMPPELWTRAEHLASKAPHRGNVCSLVRELVSKAKG